MLIDSQFKPASFVFWLFKLGWVQHRAAAKPTEHGLTLIESLIAIVVIAVTVVGITPPIFWATASRVQTQRAEQALKLAQGELDRMRTTIERDEVNNARLDQLPPVAGDEAQVRKSATDPTAIAAPSRARASGKVISAKSCSNRDDVNPPSVVNQYLRVDINSDCTPDFLVQTFRSAGLNQDGGLFAPSSATTQKLSALVMGVRVYSIVAEEELLAGRGQTQQASLKGTSGLGNQRNRPLAVLYSTIVRSTDSNNLDLYRALCRDRNAGC